MLECVVNISEGRHVDIINTLRQACGTDLLDLHSDPHHNRSVFTLVGTEAPRRLAIAACETVNLMHHEGVHPRIGAIDVVPFVPLEGSTMTEAIAARDDFARWAGTTLGLPCFLYGTTVTLPEIRRHAFDSLSPSFGPSHPHPTAGGCAVGARDVLVAYNVWVRAPDLASVRQVARAVRTPHVRTLGLAVGSRFQVSCNLIAPQCTGPRDVTRAVEQVGADHGVTVTGCELVGLLPRAVLLAIDPQEWAQLDLAADRTVEARIESIGTYES